MDFPVQIKGRGKTAYGVYDSDYCDWTNIAYKSEDTGSENACGARIAVHKKI